MSKRSPPAAAKVHATHPHWDRAQAMAQIGSVEIDFVTQTTIVSSQLCDMLGRPHDWQPTALEMVRLHPDHEQDNIQQLWRGAFANRRHRLEYQGTVVRGEQPLQLHYQGEISYSDDGEPLRLFAVVQDVTRHKTNDALMQSGSHLQAFADATPSSTLTWAAAAPT